MADIRINALATTAASTASDDFLAVDGAAQGTRKLNAFSPTFGGNLTVSGNTNTFGSGTVDTDVIVNGGAVGSYSSALKYRSAGTEYWKVGRGAATGGANFEWYDYQGTPGTRFTIASSTGNATLSGNLTVSGGTITSGSGTLTLNSSANTVVLQSAGTTALTLDSSQRCILAGALRLNNAYTAGAPTATGYVTIQDSAGNTYKVLVGT